MSAPRSPAHRREQIAARLHIIRERIDTAVARTGRTEPPTLIVVTKTYPVDDIAHLSECGIRDIGENRHQEAVSKHDSLMRTSQGERLRWHFLGQLQRNKARRILRYTHTIHSIDRRELISALDAAMCQENTGLPLNCFLQVDLEGGSLSSLGAAESTSVRKARGGAHPAEVMALAEAVASSETLHLLGVMTVAPLGWEPERAFAVLAELSEHLRATHPEASAMSAGMSADFETAIHYGATHLRVGSNVLGSRPHIR